MLSASLATWEIMAILGEEAAGTRSQIYALTGRPLSGCQIYAPMQHARRCEYHLKRDDFTIIGSEKNHYLLRLFFWVSKRVSVSTNKDPN